MQKKGWEISTHKEIFARRGAGEDLEQAGYKIWESGSNATPWNYSVQPKTKNK